MRTAPARRLAVIARGHRSLLSAGPGAGFALLSAVLFGLSTPAAKLLLSDVDPLVLAGLLYAGSGVGLWVLIGLRRLRQTAEVHEAPLRAADWPWLMIAILTGGIAGPVLLMVGLARTDAVNASLLLNAEAVFTALMAWLVFREHFDRRIVIGMTAITAGAVVLTWSGSVGRSSGWGEAAIIAACLSWAVDNNVTRKISGGDPQQIAAVKCLVAGIANLALGMAAGGSLPSISVTLAATLVGLFGYGLSLQLFVLALRHIGVARTSAYFSTAPFAGAAAAVFIFSTPLSAGLLLAGFLMAFGVWLHLSEHHAHEHRHDPTAHEHRHHHDEHHQHQHAPGLTAGKSHSHWHEHTPLVHTHRHFPDTHHRHSH